MKRLSNYLLPTFYIGIVVLLVLSSLLVVNGVKNYLKEEEIPVFTLEEVFSNDVLPVISTKNTNIIKPYNYEGVSIGRYFYDYEADKTKQESSIIYYENTYLQNDGVDYVSDEDFDVVCILDGEVESIEDSDIYGKILTIKHNDNLKSVYSGISGIEYKVGDRVLQGDIMATSSKSKLYDKKKSLLHFEIIYKDSNIDPENIYTMKVSDFE